MEAPPGEFAIFIKTLTGRVIEMRVEARDNIRTLKLKVFDKAGIEPNLQRYIFNAKQLEDDWTLWQAGVRKESIVNLIVRQEPVDAPPPTPTEEPTSRSGSNRRNSRQNNQQRQQQQRPPAAREPTAWAVLPAGKYDWLWSLVGRFLVAVWNLAAWPFRLVHRILRAPISFIFRNLVRFIFVPLGKLLRAVSENVLKPIWQRVLFPVLRFIGVSVPNCLLAWADQFLPWLDRVCTSFYHRVSPPIISVIQTALRVILNVFDFAIHSAGCLLLHPVSEMLAIPWVNLLEPLLRFVFYSAPTTTYTFLSTSLAPFGRFLWNASQRIATVVRGINTVVWDLTSRLLRLSFVRIPTFVGKRILWPLWHYALRPTLRFVFVSTPHRIGAKLRNLANALYRNVACPLANNFFRPVLRAVFISAPRSVWNRLAYPVLRFIYVRVPRSIFNNALLPLWNRVAYPAIRFAFVSVPRLTCNNALVPIWNRVGSPVLHFSFVSVPRFGYNNAVVPAARTVRNVVRATNTYLLRTVFHQFFWSTLLLPVLRLSNLYLFSPLYSRALSPLLSSSLRFVRLLVGPLLRYVNSFLLPRGVTSNGYSLDIRPARFLAPNIMVMQDNATYDIHLRNATNTRTDCTIAIDGVDVGRFRLMPNCRYVISRPVTNIQLFTFQANAAVRANVARINQHNPQFGSEVRVRFYAELPRDQHPRSLNPAPFSNSKLKRNTADESLGSLDSKVVAAAEDRGEEFVSGGTVFRGHSNQQVYSEWDALRTNPEPDVTLDVRLVGQAPPARAPAN